MAGPKSDQEKERAAKEAIRREIMEKINALEDEKAECERLKKDFGALRDQVIITSTQLRNLKLLEMHPEMGLFSGVTATATEEGISNVVGSLLAKAGVIAEVAGAIDSQIGQLNSYITELNNRIKGLEAGL